MNSERQHFLFNSLNNLKYYILVNEQDKAIKFLDHLAFLLRAEFEETSLIDRTVEEDMKIVEEFLELEKMRLEIPHQLVMVAKDEVLNYRIPNSFTRDLLSQLIVPNFSKKLISSITIQYKLEKGKLVGEIIVKNCLDIINNLNPNLLFKSFPKFQQQINANSMVLKSNTADIQILREDSSDKDLLRCDYKVIFSLV